MTIFLDALSPANRQFFAHRLSRLSLDNHVKKKSLSKVNRIVSAKENCPDFDLPSPVYQSANIVATNQTVARVSARASHEQSVIPAVLLTQAAGFLLP